MSNRADCVVAHGGGAKERGGGDVETDPSERPCVIGVVQIAAGEGAAFHREYWDRNQQRRLPLLPVSFSPL